MANDEHGMPVPPEHLPLKLWVEHEKFVDTVRDRDDLEVNIWDMPEFFVHAANWIIPCREIVRRLAEWLASDGSKESEFDIADDAAKLWAEMQRDAKGGGDA